MSKSTNTGASQSKVNDSQGISLGARERGVLRHTSNQRPVRQKLEGPGGGWGGGGGGGGGKGLDERLVEKGLDAGGGRGGGREGGAVKRRWGGVRKGG